MKPQLLKALSILHIKIDPTCGFSYNTICDNLPNSDLLKNNALFSAIKNNTLLFSHQTTKYTQIMKEKKIFPGWGCLGRVLYTTPLYINGTNYLRDNFFELVLSHQDNASIKEIIIENKNSMQCELYGMNYLLAGLLLFEIIQETYIKNTFKYKQISKNIDKLLKSVINIVQSTISDEKQIIDNICFLAKSNQFFAYIYYEALSQIVMLCAQDKKTIILHNKGEFNSHCYYDIIKEYSGISGERFDASKFCPNYVELHKLLNNLKKNSLININPNEVIKKLIINIHSIIRLLDKDKQLKQHLISQTSKTNLDPKEQIFLLDRFNNYLDCYRKDNDISLIINVATFKPEIGIPPNAKINLYEISQDSTLSKLDIVF